MRPLIIWDGDDTLWFVEPLYDAARSEVAEFVGSVGLDSVRWETIQRAIDVENVTLMGLSRTRFPTSCVEAYRALAETDVEIELRIRELAEQVFSLPAPLASGATEALSAASTFADQVLLTKGDFEVQAERVERSGLRGFFTDVVAVEDKDSVAFAGLAAIHGRTPSECWSIGNSLPSDINTALMAGMSAIWIDAHVWEHERRETESVLGNLYTASSLDDAVGIVYDARQGAAT